METLLRREEEIFHKLLGDGRTALLNIAGLHVDHQGPDNGDRIDPDMVIEIAVLCCEESADDMGRKAGRIDRLAPILTANANDFTIRRVDLDPRLLPRRSKIPNRRETATIDQKRHKPRSEKEEGRRRCPQEKPAGLAE